MPIFSSLFKGSKSEKPAERRVENTVEGRIRNSGETPSTPSPCEEARIVVQVMGSGCDKCRQMHKNALEAARLVDGKICVEYITDLVEIAASGVVSTPALRINGRIVSSGKVLSAKQIAKLLSTR